MASKAQEYRVLNATDREMSLADLHEAMGKSLTSMIELQMDAYPSSWTVKERREAAERQLFGGVR